MPELPPELSQRAAALANRLRLVQLDFADEGDGTRRGQLEEEVERALSAVTPDQREPFLQRLGEMFPSWDANVTVAPRAEAAAARSGIDEKELRNASFLVERLAELAPQLGEEERAAIAARLARVGLALPGGGEGIPEPAAEKLRQRLSIPPATALNAGRTAELTTLLAELALSLDQIVWSTWRAIAPRSDFKKESDLGKNLHRFVSGDQDTARGQVKVDLERVRKLTAALIASVGQAGRQFSQQHFQRFGVEAIRNTARPKKVMEHDSIRMWEKYAELAGAMDAGSLERELMGAIAKYVEDLVKGTNR
ncbi:MAG: hypothetical protein IT437_11850 [Phycisphaerales bacterium]|nr:hypothetical protein [Phycisphaerales bacterium]